MKDLHEVSVLVIDDQPQNVRLVESSLRRAGFPNVVGETDAARGIDLWRELQPDLLVLDLDMPGIDGFEVMERIQQESGEASYLAILILSGDMAREVKLKALSAGAKDFVSKPFETTDLVLRSKNLIQTRLLHLQLQRQNVELDRRVRARTTELEEARFDTLNRLALAAEYRDDDTGEHTRRVGHLSAALATEMGLSAQEVDVIGRAAPLHDVGKIGIPDSILLKPGRLTAEEFEQMRTHSRIGGDLLTGSSFPLLLAAEEIARYHHERWDGTGYEGLAGQEIPLAGRIVAVADVFDALTHRRPYKEAWSVEDAIAEIDTQAGAQFDPAVVGAFRRVIRTGAACLESEAADAA